jgi:hypothetical protein
MGNVEGEELRNRKAPVAKCIQSEATQSKAAFPRNNRLHNPPPSNARIPWFWSISAAGLLYEHEPTHTRQHAHQWYGSLTPRLSFETWHLVRSQEAVKENRMTERGWTFSFWRETCHLHASMCFRVPTPHSNFISSHDSSWFHIINHVYAREHLFIKNETKKNRVP